MHSAWPLSTPGRPSVRILLGISVLLRNEWDDNQEELAQEELAQEEQEDEGGVEPDDDHGNDQHGGMFRHTTF